MRHLAVAHLTTVHSRYDVRIFEKEAASLAQAGFETILVVGDGSGDEERRGVRVLDVGVAPFGRLGRMLIQPLRVWRRARRLRAALYHFHDPELIPIALVLRGQGAKVIYDSHEDVPKDILAKAWIPPAWRTTVAWAFERFEAMAVKRLSAVVSPTPYIRERFARQCRSSVCIANYPSIGELDLPTSVPARERVVCYVGGVARNRGIIELVRAVALVPDLRLLLCGTIESEQLQAELEREPGWSRVEYLGQVDRLGVAKVMARSRIGLVTLHPIVSYIDALPIKMFEYMSAGLPVVASDFPLWRRILVDEDAGICVDPLSPSQIAAAIRELLGDPSRATAMGERGRAAVLTRYRWDREAEKLVALYRELLAES